MKPFDSINKSFEDRFDPKMRTIGEAQLQNYDDQKEGIPPSKFFSIEFSKSIPEKIKNFLKGKVPDILDYSEKFGIEIPHADHLLRFIDQETYETEIGSALPKNVSLPASRLKIINTKRSYEVTIILPQELDSAELIVNITRNLFSKLSGSIFFNEKILPLEFYRYSVNNQKQSSAAIPEILSMVEELNFSSKSLQAFCENVAESYLLDHKKEGLKIRKQLISEWREKFKSRSLSTEEYHTIDTIYREFKELYRTNPVNYNQALIERIQKLNAQLQFILPHEKLDYQKFKQKHFPHFIRSVKNKLEEISALSGFIEEFYDLLNRIPEGTDIETIGVQIRSRMQELRFDRKVIQFYVPDMPQNPKLNRIRQRFPLNLIKMLPTGTPLKEWSKEIKRLEKNYAESIYSKIYASFYGLSEWTFTIQGEKDVSYRESTDYQRLKKLLSVLKYRAPAIDGLKSTLGVILDLNEQSLLEIKEDETPRQLIPLDDLNKAWSYFISSILSMQYYQQPSASATLPQGFRTDNYMSSIMEFVDRQCSLGINHFHIVKLLLLIYEKKGTNALNFLLYCFQRPQDILRYTLYLTTRPQTGDISLEKRLEKLFQYRDSLISVYQNRLNESGK